MNRIVSTAMVLVALPVAAVCQQTRALKLDPIPHALYWENVPQAYTIDQDRLTITAGEKTDMFRDPNVTYNTDNAPKLLFMADSNFVLTAAISHGFHHKWDGGALVLRQDSLNWVKFCFEKDYTGANRVVSVVTKNVSDDCNSAEIPGNRVLYKMAKAGNVITLYYALDGKNWLLIRHVQISTTGRVAVGFLAQSPTGPGCRVAFESITYTNKKISDPYLGE